MEVLEFVTVSYYRCHKHFFELPMTLIQSGSGGGVLIPGPLKNNYLLKKSFIQKLYQTWSGYNAVYVVREITVQQLYLNNVKEQA